MLVHHFQEKALFPHMSVRDNIAFGIRKERTRNKVVAHLLEMLKITNLASKFPHEISGGEQQRVALARSIAPAPKLLMLDEPFGALDQSLKNELYSEISKVLSEKQITILLVTHDRDEVRILTDRQLEIGDLQKK